MRARTLVTALAVLPMALGSLANSSPVPENCRDIGKTADDPIIVCTERVYVHCQDDTVKVNNVQANSGTFPTWDTTAPSGSVSDGAGCGHYENLLTSTSGPDPLFDLIWEGEFTGRLDNMAVELHNIHVSSFRALGTYWIGLTIEIDGVTVFQNPDVDSFVQLTPEPSETGLSEKMEFTLRNIGLLDDGDDTTHTIKIGISSYNETQAAWVWDTTEVPAGITFNLKGTRGTPLTPNA